MPALGLGAGVLGVEDLDRHAPPQEEVAGRVDEGCPAAADDVVEAVAADEHAPAQVQAAVAAGTRSGHLGRDSGAPGTDSGALGQHDTAPGRLYLGPCAGMTPKIWDRDTGEATEVELFLAVLGASNYTGPLGRGDNFAETGGSGVSCRRGKRRGRRTGPRSR